MYLTMCDIVRIVRSLYNKDLYDHNFQDYVMPQECCTRFIAEVYENTIVIDPVREKERDRGRGVRQEIRALRKIKNNRRCGDTESQ